MQNQPRRHSLQMEYEIEFTPGTVPRPSKLKMKQPRGVNRQSDNLPPLKYMADVLVGLSLVKLQGNSASKLINSNFSVDDLQFSNLAWKTLDPHFELYWKTQARLQELWNEGPKLDPQSIERLEKNLDETLFRAQKPWGIEVQELHSFLEKIYEFEEALKTPLLFNFSLKFSQGFVDKMHALFSLLFHLRALVGLEHNNQVIDSTHHSVRVDSISDYLARAEYIANDAALYVNFKKLSKPFMHHKATDTRFEKLMIEPLTRCFEMWTHHAVSLVENLSTKALGNLTKSRGLEEDLYRIQMDWLLGAPAGLLFRIREELFGLSQGYEKVFWSDVTDRRSRSPQSLTMSFTLKEQDVFGLHDTA